MIELHLIGYTSDLRYLVLDLEPEGERGRYRLVVDGDLLLTLDELRDLRAQAGMDVGIPYERLEERLGIVIGRGERAPEQDGPPTASDREEPGHARDREPVTARPPTSQPPPAPPPEDPPPATVRVVDGMEPPVQEQGVPWDPGAEAASRSENPDRQGAVDEAEQPEEPEQPDEPEQREQPEEPEQREQPEQAERMDEAEQPDTADVTSDGPAAPGRDSELTPAQIQSRLRAGRRPESVAEEAGTEVAWVERWLPPILTERAQVLQEARSLYLERPRKGRSHAPLGESVAANLRRRHLDPEEDAEWSVKRRVNGRWSINVRYRYRNKTRSATWALDREEGELTASSQAARDLGWTDDG